MSIRKVAPSFLIFLILFVFGCGYGNDDRGKTSIFISGTVDVGEIEGNINGPVLLEVSNTDDLEKIEENPDDTIIKVITVDKSDYTFRIDLTDEDLKAGDEVYITAFVDNDYEGDIPYPTKGDFVGFYIDTNRMATSYEIKSGENDGIDIKIWREVFDFDAQITGTVGGDETGELTILAYAGDVTSSDFSKLDPDGIVGYKKLSKDKNPVSYTMDVLPYGYNIPIEDVYVFALLDVNENGTIDGGDRVGYYSTEDNDLPTLVTVNVGANQNIDVDFHMDVMEPSGLDISLKGCFTPPDDYNIQSPPVYIIVAETDNLDTLFDTPISAIKYFEKMPPGEFIFSITRQAFRIRPVVIDSALCRIKRPMRFPLNSKMVLTLYRRRDMNSSLPRMYMILMILTMGRREDRSSILWILKEREVTILKGLSLSSWQFMLAVCPSTFQRARI
ncbi:MAG: hypothetical protein JRC60_06440 [Deltaproteobacteria bacterium]|nr:hypothetical protein [Deltaproteobacteria bacterium]